MKVQLGDNIHLRCQVCGEDEFVERNAQLNTAGMTMMNLDFLNESATCFVCLQCGYVHWFATKGAKIQPVRDGGTSKKDDRWVPPGLDQ